MARVSELEWLCVDADAGVALQLWDGLRLARVDTPGLVVHHSVIGACPEFEEFEIVCAMLRHLRWLIRINHSKQDRMHLH